MRKAKLFFLLAGITAAGVIALGTAALTNRNFTFTNAGDKPSHSITFTSESLIEDMYEVDGSNYGTAFLSHRVDTCDEQLELSLSFWSTDKGTINEDSLCSFSDAYSSGYLMLEFNLFYGATFSSVRLNSKAGSPFGHKDFDGYSSIVFDDLVPTKNDEMNRNEFSLYNYGFSEAVIDSIVITYTC